MPLGPENPGECDCERLPPDGGSVSADPGPQDIIEGILGTPVVDFLQYTEFRPTGVETANSNPDIAPRVPFAFGDVAETGALLEQLDAAELERLDALFLDGGAFSILGTSTRHKALSLDPEVPATLEEGLYLFVWQTMLAPIPISDSTQLLQYAFVADRDRQVVNNYRGQEPFEDDYFDATDLWFVLEYDPQGGWVFEVTDALNGALTPRASAARGILSGATNMFVIPVSEFDGSSTIAARWTAFAHEGDFGQQGGPWSGDPTPPVGTLLEQISLSPVP
ncbi:MAG: hypothetical protein ACN4G0_03235 [Polyangiales bacterium]